MMQMLGPPMPGFMTPGRAIQDAFEDLRTHELGVIAGTRAVFAEILRRFDPSTLEEQLGKAGMLATLLPTARRAKLWELFQAGFNDMCRQAEQDFDALLAKTFKDAYEDEIARQRGSQHKK